MITKFVIEDELHAEICGEYDSFTKAISELERRAFTPWYERPDIAPCINWANCGRHYEIIKYETKQTPWSKIQSWDVLDISAEGVFWKQGFPNKNNPESTSSDKYS